MRVKFDGQPYNTDDSGLATSVKFERYFKIPFADAFPQDTAPRVEHMAFLAWAGLVKAGVTALPFADEFLDKLEFDPEAAADETTAEAAAPLDPAAPVT